MENYSCRSFKASFFNSAKFYFFLFIFYLIHISFILLSSIFYFSSPNCNMSFISVLNFLFKSCFCCLFSSKLLSQSVFSVYFYSLDRLNIYVFYKVEWFVWGTFFIFSIMNKPVSSFLPGLKKSSEKVGPLNSGVMLIFGVSSSSSSSTMEFSIFGSFF